MTAAPRATACFWVKGALRDDLPFKDHLDVLRRSAAADARGQRSGPRASRRHRQDRCPLTPLTCPVRLGARLRGRGFRPRRVLGPPRGVGDTFGGPYPGPNGAKVSSQGREPLESCPQIGFSPVGATDSTAKAGSTRHTDASPSRRLAVPPCRFDILAFWSFSVSLR